MATGQHQEATHSAGNSAGIAKAVVFQGTVLESGGWVRELRVVHELRVLHERLEGSTHKDTAHTVGFSGAKASIRLQQRGLARWGAASLEEYRPRHAECLRVVAVACEEESRNPAVSVYGQQFAASMAAMCIVMHNMVEAVPLVGTRA